MKKLLLDTNIIIDLLAKREPFYKNIIMPQKLSQFLEKSNYWLMFCH